MAPSSLQATHGASPATGRGWGLLLGAGLLYLLSVPPLLLGGGEAKAGDWPLGIAWFIAILINGPHYGATLLRVYERREERRRYAAFALWITLVLGIAFVAGLRLPLLASLLVTAYFTWSPWHFAGQNYGVALMFLRRARVEVDPRTARWLQASFALSFALSVVALNALGSTSLQAPTRSGRYEDLMLLRLGLPIALTRVLLIGFGAAYLCSLVAVAIRLRRVATATQALPVGCLLLCQALWFVVPSVLDATGGWSARSLAFAAIWISAAHSLQYLWVTFHFARRCDAGVRLSSYLLRTTLIGNAAIVIPGVLFAPGLLGANLHWDSGLATLVFAVVNRHHFVLDGAVWKLRDGRVANLLLVDGAPSVAPLEPSRGSRATRVLWALLGLCLVVEFAELTLQQALRWGRWEVADAALAGLERAGRDHALARIRVGRALLEDGRPEAAREQFERSLAARPSRAAWGGLGRCFEREGDWQRAAEAYEAGAELAPDDAPLLRSAGFALLRTGEPQRAEPLLERALALDPRHEPTQRALENARRALGE